MDQQQMPDKRVSPNPAITELQNIKQELVKLRQDFNKQVTKSVDSSSSFKDQKDSISRPAVILKLILWISAFFAASGTLSAGSEMSAISSVSGTSVAEVYYQSMGKFLTGFSFFLGAILIYVGYVVTPVGFLTGIDISSVLRSRK